LEKTLNSQFQTQEIGCLRIFFFAGGVFDQKWVFDGKDLYVIIDDQVLEAWCENKYTHQWKEFKSRFLRHEGKHSLELTEAERKLLGLASNQQKISKITNRKRKGQKGSH